MHHYLLTTANSNRADSPLSRAKAEVTIRFLLEIHNLAPQGSEIQSRVIEAIQNAAHSNDKAHWARGLVQTTEGELLFDEARYDRAVYQGKQDTYAKAAKQAFGELQRALEMVANYQIQERIAIEAVTDQEIHVRPLVDLTEPTRPAALLKGIEDTLPRFLELMTGGMDVALTGRQSPELSRLETHPAADTDLPAKRSIKDQIP